MNLTVLSTMLFPYTTLFRSGNGREGAAVLDHALRSCRRQCHCSAALGFAPLAGVASGVLVRIAFLHRLTLDLSGADRKSTRLNSSHVAISYAVFCLKKKNLK